MRRRKWSWAPQRWGTVLILLGGLLLWTSVPLSAKVDGGVNWLPYEEGMKKARESNKPVLLKFYTDWCTWCKKMDADTYADREIQRYLDLNFISIKINAESKELVRSDGKEMKMKDLARKFGVRGFPTVIFLESDGKPIAPLAGYSDPGSFRKVLAFIQEKAYKKMTFEEFTKQRADAR